MNTLKRLSKKIISVILIVATFLISSGSIFATAALDVQNNPENFIYTSYSIDTMQSDAKNNNAKADVRYSLKRVATVGSIDSKSSSNNKLVLKSESGSRIDITVRDKDLIAKVGDMKTGDKVKVLGLATLKGLASKEVTINAEAIRMVTSLAIEDGAYEFKSGKSFSEKQAQERSLGKGTMKYKIPAEWAEVEKKLENIEGYQYKLNEIASTYATEAEQIYVFYFDNEQYLQTQNDRSKTKPIERAIIENILRGENPYIIYSMTADYGREFQFYDAKTFIDFNRKGHNVEFVFSPAGDKGICCYMYVYNNSVHREDILFSMRTLETE